MIRKIFGLGNMIRGILDFIFYILKMIPKVTERGISLVIETFYANQANTNRL